MPDHTRVPAPSDDEANPKPLVEDYPNFPEPDPDPDEEPADPILPGKPAYDGNP